MKTTSGAEINELAARALNWVDQAEPRAIWDVMQHGGIDARVHMPGAYKALGMLEGPGPFLEELQRREWAEGAKGDLDELAEWFVADTAAQQAARQEIRHNIHEMAFDIGEWEWQTTPAEG